MSLRSLFIMIALAFSLNASWLQAQVFGPPAPNFETEISPKELYGPPAPVPETETAGTEISLLDIIALNNGDWNNSAGWEFCCELIDIPPIGNHYGGFGIGVIEYKGSNFQCTLGPALVDSNPDIDIDFDPALCFTIRITL